MSLPPDARSAGCPPVDPDTPAVSPRLRVGERLGKYLLTAKLGHGAEGMVYRALHPGLNADRAIKVLHYSARNGPAVRERIRHEASLLAQLNHRNIVRIFDFEDDPETPYLVMEFVEGLNLAELITQGGRVPPERAAEIVLQVAEGLACARSYGIIHRDIKPANILLTKDGTAKVADLGTGLLGTGTDGLGANSGPLRVVGTLFYMAPEQVDAPGSIDHRADIYALGATFYHAVTGRVPFEGKSLREVVLKKAMVANTPALWVPPHQLEPSVPPEFSSVIQAMMAANRDDRYADYPQLITDLQGLGGRRGAQLRSGSTAQSTTGLAARTARGTEPESRPGDISQSDTNTVRGGRQSTLPTPASQLAGVLKAALAAITRGQRPEARQMLLPLKAHHADNEMLWMLLIKASATTAEAVALVEEGLGHLPSNPRLELVRGQLQQQTSPVAALKKCPFCATLSTERTGPCPNCGGKDSLSNPEGWGSHRLAKPELVRRAAASYEKALRDKADPRWSLALALAHLNLGAYAAALPHLHEIARQRPDFPGLREQIAVAERLAPPPRGPRIVVVDDSPTIRKLVSQKLQEFDYEVVALADGDEAIARLPDLAPDLVLLDINMPGKDGYQVCRWIKHSPVLKRVPVIMLSGQDGFFDKIRGRMAGASRHIGKPFDTDELLQVVDKYCPRTKRP